jgi:hypothetical protein
MTALLVISDSSVKTGLAAGFLPLYLVRPFRFSEVGLTADEDRLAVESAKESRLGL